MKKVIIDSIGYKNLTKAQKIKVLKQVKERLQKDQYGFICNIAEGLGMYNIMELIPELYQHRPKSIQYEWFSYYTAWDSGSQYKMRITAINKALKDLEPKSKKA